MPAQTAARRSQTPTSSSSTVRLACSDMTSCVLPPDTSSASSVQNPGSTLAVEAKPDEGSKPSSRAGSDEHQKATVKGPPRIPIETKPGSGGRCKSPDRHHAPLPAASDTSTPRVSEARAPKPIPYPSLRESATTAISHVSGGNGSGNHGQGIGNGHTPSPLDIVPPPQVDRGTQPAAAKASQPLGAPIVIRFSKQVVPPRPGEHGSSTKPVASTGQTPPDKQVTKYIRHDFKRHKLAPLPSPYHSRSGVCAVPPKSEAEAARSWYILR